MAAGMKRKRTVEAVTQDIYSKKQATISSGLNTAAVSVPKSESRSGSESVSESEEDMSAQLRRIATSSRTPFEKRVWTLLCQIPAGRVSTYGLLASHMGSSPRAVGNALRRNPFAPEVPCHRVVATGGALGGFKGHPSRDGEGITIGEKKSLLRGEGVRIDERGRVLGTPWSGFVSEA